LKDLTHYEARGTTGEILQITLSYIIADDITGGFQLTVKDCNGFHNWNEY
jgi:hypothetical protein